jgi:hypothetical protein
MFQLSLSEFLGVQFRINNENKGENSGMGAMMLKLKRNLSSVFFLAILIVGISGPGYSSTVEPVSSFPKLGERIYTIPESANRTDSSKVTNIMELKGNESSDAPMLRDPISDRKIEVKHIIGGSRYITAIELQEEPPKVKTAFVTISPMAIMGKSNEPSMRLDVEREQIGTSDAVRAPRLLRGMFNDAKKFN